MKKSVATILDGCQPQELDGFLENVSGGMPADMNADAIKTLAMQKAGVRAKRAGMNRIVLIAACITLVAAVLVGCYVAEKVEYDTAVKFFDLNDLDTEGMSRDDIKRVWRDITTESFSYDKSYELLSKNSDTNAVEGFNIRISNSANNSANLPAVTRQDVVSGISEKGASYLYNSDVGTVYDADDEDYTYYQNAFIEKYMDAEQVWHTAFKRDFYINGYDVRDGRVLVWGEDMYDVGNNYIHTAVALLDDSDGTVLWEQTLDSRYHFDEYEIAALGADGRSALLTIACDDRFADENILIFRELDMDGNIVTEHEQKMQKFLFNRLLTPLSDGWLAEIEVENSEPDVGYVEYIPKLVKFNFDGEIVSEWTLTEDHEDGHQYDIISITEHEEKVFLSAQARPNESTLYAGDTLGEIVDIKNLADGYTDEWRDRARWEFSAVLFVLDPASGKPEQFYSVGGAMPVGALFAQDDDFSADEDGNLVWHIGRIIRCGYSPYTSSFSIYGVTRQYDYTFDRDDNILRQDKTDLFGFFRTH